MTSLEATKVSFTALGKIERWLAFGGEQRAGLPPWSMNGLGVATQSFKGHILQLQSDLAVVRDDWSRLGSDIRGEVQKLIVELYNLSLTTKAMIAEATDVHVKAQDALTLVRLHIEEVTRKSAEAESRLRYAQQQRDQARRDLAAAKAELSGDKGFLNGFLTGITIGIYNPVKENIDKANAAVSKNNAEVAVISNQINTLNQCQSELNESNAILETLTSLDSALTDYQNALDTASMSLGKAYDDEEHAVDAQTGGAASYYRQRARTDMARLIEWIDTFESAR